MGRKISFRDISYGLRQFRNFLAGRKYTLHNRFPPFIAPRTIPEPDIPRTSIKRYSDNYYANRHAFESVKPPVVAPVAEGALSKGGCSSTQTVNFKCAPTPGPVWWWDGHKYYVEDKKQPSSPCTPAKKD